MEKVKIISILLCRLVLAVVFIYAGIQKFLQPDVFFEEIEAYRLLPNAVAYFCAYFLPPLEIVVGIGILFRATMKWSALLIIVLNVVFIFAILSAWIRGLDIDCGCFGESDELIANYSIYYAKIIMRDFLFIIMGAVIFSYKHRVTKQNKL
jgi:Predicted membrane protein